MCMVTYMRGRGGDVQWRDAAVLLCCVASGHLVRYFLRSGRLERENVKNAKMFLRRNLQMTLTRFPWDLLTRTERRSCSLMYSPCGPLHLFHLTIWDMTNKSKSSSSFGSSSPRSCGTSSSWATSCGLTNTDIKIDLGKHHLHWSLLLPAPGSRPGYHKMLH